MKLGLGSSLRSNNSGFSRLNDILLAECDVLTDFDYIYSCDKVLDEANKQSGSGSLNFTKNNTVAGYFSMDITGNIDLSKYTSLKYLFYTADKSNIASISSTLFTTDPYDYNQSYIYFVGWQINNGWNSFDIPLVDFTKAGEGTLADIKAIRFTVNLTVDNNTESVNFDRIEAIL
jgi:hypothetical protein